MAVAKSWRAVLVGYWTQGPWTGEMVTTGISGVGVDGGGNFGPAILQPLPSFEANPSGEYEDKPTFEVYYGSVGPSTWSKATQDSIATALWGITNALKGGIPSSLRFEEVRVSAFNAAFDTINGASVYYFKTPVGGLLTKYSSPSDAVAVTLRSGARGPRGRGRMFLPAMGDPGSSDGLVPGGYIQDYGTAVKNLVTGLDGLNSVSPAIVSRAANAYSTITRVEVGDEMDDVSRRRRRRRETYTSFSV